MVSIICASNNLEIFENNLKSSLKNQNYKDYELIFVDTNMKKFNGASEALNYGAIGAKGEYLMFCHHDVIFENENELTNIINYVESIKDFGVIGVAGKNEQGIIGNITDGKPKHKISKIEIMVPTEVQTLDEVLFVIKKELFMCEQLSVDNMTWHLYSVEYCLRMKNINKKNYVIPSSIYHVSDGASLNNSYYHELIRYSKNFKYTNKIFTTIRDWDTNPLVLRLEILRCKLGFFLSKYKIGIKLIKLLNKKVE